ncbi:MAG: GGDEF domain-containing protein [Bacillus sp. (in: Bacteria)]|nr:GGDEF domain-containing protein [Bacillus sp. (in: firmicutes)]MCM1428016.1 GGDEF domain-containing protein [Eubacterium sp.]
MKKPKKITKKIILQALWITYALVNIIIWLPKVDKLFSQDYASISEHISLNDSWDITIGDDTYHDIALDTFKFDAVNKGTKIIMTRMLPDNWDMAEGALRLHIRQTVVSVYIDDKPIYQYGHSRMLKNKTVGSGYLFVNLPNEYQGKEITIRLILAEDKAFTSFDPIHIYEWQNAYRMLLTENRLPMFLGCFLTIFGLVTCFITIFALAFSTKYIRMLCLSVFAICTGLWTLCYYNVIAVFSIPLYSISMLEYITLYLAPVPLIIYLWTDVQKLEKHAFKVCYWLLSVFHIAATAVMLALHATDTLHCAATLKYMQTLLVISLLYFIFIEIMNLKSSRTNDRLFLVGMLLVAICVSYDLIGYSLNRYSGRSIFTLKGVTSMGLVIFIFILIGSFYIDLTQKLMQETERNFLIKSAYTDELTQIHNRRYCMEYMNKIKDSESIDYTVICFDVNNLKTVNDTYGHAKGDILIKSAADVISETFGKHGVVARMGGDEFISIIETSETEEINRLMELFRQNMDSKNEEIPDLHMSIAYGYASCNPKEYNIEKIYQIADNRMYEKKKQMKQEKLSS